MKRGLYLYENKPTYWEGDLCTYERDLYRGKESYVYEKRNTYMKIYLHISEQTYMYVKTPLYMKRDSYI